MSNAPHDSTSHEQEAEILDAIEKWLERDVRPHVLRCIPLAHQRQCPCRHINWLLPHVELGLPCHPQVEDIIHLSPYDFQVLQD